MMHDGGFSPRLEERRKANVFVNGTYENNGGKTLYLPEEMSMAQLLNAAGRRLNMDAQRVFNSDGHEIDDLILIDSDDVLFFSGGENFIVPRRTSVASSSTSFPRRSCSAPELGAAAIHRAHGYPRLNNAVALDIQQEQQQILEQRQLDVEGVVDHNSSGSSSGSKRKKNDERNNGENGENGGNGENGENRENKTHVEREPMAAAVVVGGYEVLELIGQGAFGEVYKGVHQVTRDVVALKFLTKKKMTSALAAQKVFTEIHCLETLQHSHVIKLLGVKNADTHMVLVFEYAGGGDLKQYLEARRTSSDGPVTEEEACDMFRAIVDGVSYCHKKNIVHRDLKLDNILLTTESSNSGDNGSGGGGGGDNGGGGDGGDGGGDNNSGKSSRSPSPITSGESQRIANGIKVADFGLSSIYRPGNASTSKAGSLAYIAPEVLGDQEFLGPPCDVWSLGVILFALVCGRLPFDGDSYNEVKQRVIEGKYTFTEQERSHLSHEVKDLLSKVLRRHPNERLGVGGMINHPWMEKYAQYTVRRISGMNFPIHNVDDTIKGRKSRSSSVISVNSVMSGEEKIESGDDDSSRDSVRTRYTPSPPVKPRSPPSKGRIIMQQQQQQQLKKSASVGSLINRAAPSFRSPSPTSLRNSAGISSMSLGGRAISPVSSSHQRLVRTMNETNHVSSSSNSSKTTLSRFSGTPPRGPSLRTGWSTPTGSRNSSPIKISSSSSGAATTTTTTTTPNRSTLTNNPSPQSSPIPLSLFEQRINNSSAPTSSASSSSSNHPGGTSGLFIHEGQAESFQRVQTTSSPPLSTSLAKEKNPHVSTKM